VRNGEGTAYSNLQLQFTVNLQDRHRECSLKKTRKKKYLDVKNLELINGTWVASEIEMTITINKHTLYEILLKLVDIKFNQDLDANFFSVKRIEKEL